MKTYSLLFRRDNPASPLRVEFDITNTASLFQIAERYVTGSAAELWEGSQYVGEVRRSEKGYWLITSQASSS